MERLHEPPFVRAFASEVGARGLGCAARSTLQWRWPRLLAVGAEQPGTRPAAKVRDDDRHDPSVASKACGWRAARAFGERVDVLARQDRAGACGPE